MAQGYCKHCRGMRDGQSRGTQFQCSECKRYSPQQNVDAKQELPSDYRFTSDGIKADAVIYSEKPIITEQDAIEILQIDLNQWKIEKIEYGGSQGYRKDRVQDIKWENGKIADGSYTKDSGKLLIAQLHSFKITLVRRTAEIRNELVVSDLIERAQKYAPKYPKIKYPKIENGHLLEIGMPDLQLGRLVMAEETGHDVDPMRQIGQAKTAIRRLLAYAKSFPVSKILFPIGNDFFNSNNAEMTTSHGTPQQDDVRWQRTYDLGCSFLTDVIDELMLIAPVDIKIVPGNHDTERIFYLGSYLKAFYRNCPNVEVDNAPNKRKYYSFGRNLLGLTHGYYEKNGKLDSLMAYERPELWAKSVNREWHLGDLHHKVDMIMKTHEFENGVVVRILRSLSDPSVWEHDKGFVGSLKAAEAFLWDEDLGVVGQFTATGK